MVIVMEVIVIKVMLVRVIAMAVANRTFFLLFFFFFCYADSGGCFNGGVDISNGRKVIMKGGQHWK